MSAVSGGGGDWRIIKLSDRVSSEEVPRKELERETYWKTFENVDTLRRNLVEG